jgi:hypothetical protein
MFNFYSKNITNVSTASPSEERSLSIPHKLLFTPKKVGELNRAKKQLRFWCRQENEGSLLRNPSQPTNPQLSAETQMSNCSSALFSAEVPG